jgi:hypothetical protein
MSFLRRTRPEDPAMPEHPDTDDARRMIELSRVDLDDHVQKISLVTGDPGAFTQSEESAGGMYPTGPSDTSTRLEAPPQIEDDREDCPSCHGTGKVLTTADYLREIVAMLPGDDVSRDMIIADFYRRLVGDDTVKGAATHLREFFPSDLITGDALNSKGNRQRDQLFNALADILSRYDPDHPGGDSMRSLRTNAETWGRSHAWWYRPSDGSLYIPTPDDYIAVRNVLVSLLTEGLGAKLTVKHVQALAQAYHSVSGWMQVSADDWRMTNPHPAVARRTRPAAER